MAPLLANYYWRRDHDPGTFTQPHDPVYDLLNGLRDDRPFTPVTMGSSYAGKQDS